MIVHIGLLCTHVEEKLGWNNIETFFLNDETCMHKKTILMKKQLSLIQTAQWISVVHPTTECCSNKAVEAVFRFHGDKPGGSRSYCSVCGWSVTNFTSSLSDTRVKAVGTRLRRMLCFKANRLLDSKSRLNLDANYVIPPPTPSTSALIANINHPFSKYPSSFPV